MGCVEETWCHGVCGMMFLRRDNHMQNKEYIQSGTLKILLSVHALKIGTKGVKNKSKGVTPCRGHPPEVPLGKQCLHICKISITLK